MSLKTNLTDRNSPDDINCLNEKEYLYTFSHRPYTPYSLQLLQ